MKFLLLIVFLVPSFANEKECKEEFTEANNQFAPDLYQKIAQNSSRKNLIISPLSVSTILGLLQLGARCQTEKQIQQSLHLPEGQQHLITGIKATLPKLQTPQNQSYIFNLANRIYVRQNLEINQTYRQLAEEVFRAGVESINVARPQDSAQQINRWVASQTNNTINDLVTAGDIDQNTELVLVSALRYKGNWTIPFEKADTEKKTFFTGRKNVQAETMHLKNKALNYYECTLLDIEFVELSLHGGASLVLALPEEGSDLEQVEKEISGVMTTSIKFAKTLINLALPKFSFVSKIDLGPVLEQLGFEDIFSGQKADLSGIAGKKGDLVVSQVVHKAFIDLNEAGLEATAATRLGTSRGSLPLQPPQAKNVTIDRPFVFFVIDQGVIVFSGRVYDPTC